MRLALQKGLGLVEVLVLLGRRLQLRLPRPLIEVHLVVLSMSAIQILLLEVAVGFHWIYIFLGEAEEPFVEALAFILAPRELDGLLLLQVHLVPFHLDQRLVVFLLLPLSSPHVLSVCIVAWPIQIFLSIFVFVDFSEESRLPVLSVLFDLNVLEGS